MPVCTIVRVHIADRISLLLTHVTYQRPSTLQGIRENMCVEFLCVPMPLTNIAFIEALHRFARFACVLCSLECFYVLFCVACLANVAFFAPQEKFLGCLSFVACLTCWECIINESFVACLAFEFLLFFVAVATEWRIPLHFGCIWMICTTLTTCVAVLTTAYATLLQICDLHFEVGCRSFLPAYCACDE